MPDKEQSNNETEQQFAINKIYIKDISFESPNSPAQFTADWKPESNMELNTNGRPLEEKVYEVVLSITVTVKNNEQTAYLVEVQQCGIFSIDGFNEQDLSHMLGSFCPNILFPYAREAISDIITRGGFPQLLLAPVNFDALYAQHLQQMQKDAEQSETH